jgi:hypothetical protein
MAPIPFDWFTESDKPTLLMFRVEIDPETEAMRLSSTARFESGTAGPKRFEEKLRAAIAKSGEHPVLQLLKPFFARLEYEIDGCDLIVSVSYASVEEMLRGIPFQHTLPLLVGWFAVSAAAEPQFAAMPVPVAVEAGAEEEEEEEVEEEKEEKKKEAKAPEKGGEKKVGQPAK